MLALTPPELVELLVTLPADRTPFIWGPPGIGKSALVRDAALFLDLPCVTLLGTQIAPEDLIGVPRIRAVDVGGVDGERGFATEFCPPRAILRSVRAPRAAHRPDHRSAPRPLHVGRAAAIHL